MSRIHCAYLNYNFESRKGKVTHTNSPMIVLWPPLHKEQIIKVIICAPLFKFLAILPQVTNTQ